MNFNSVKVGQHGVTDVFEISNNNPLVVIAGPCLIESLEHCLMIGEIMKNICEKNGAN